MASMHLVRPEKSAGRHGEALVDADHTIKMCFNPATAPSPSFNKEKYEERSRARRGLCGHMLQELPFWLRKMNFLPGYSFSMR